MRNTNILLLYCQGQLCFFLVRDTDNALALQTMAVFFGGSFLGLKMGTFAVPGDFPKHTHTYTNTHTIEACAEK